MPDNKKDRPRHDFLLENKESDVGSSFAELGTQSRGLWARLPRLAQQRTGGTCLFIDARGRVAEIE